MKLSQIGAVILFVLGLAAAGYLWKLTVPSESEISAASEPVEQVELGRFSDPIFSRLRARQIQGEVPVTIQPPPESGDLGREDPFGSF